MYKRQSYGGIEFDLNPIDIYEYSDMIEHMSNFMTGLNAVSYTHLDVYKRQLLFNALPVILRWWDSRIVRLMPFISSPCHPFAQLLMTGISSLPMFPLLTRKLEPVKNVATAPPSNRGPVSYTHLILDSLSQSHRNGGCR